LETQEEKEIAKPWLETPINTDKIKTLTKNIVAVFSDDDPDVSLDDSKLFKERLGAKIIVEHNKGHFSDDACVTELPVVLKELLAMR
jgi:predicted alpha/beta hydrolase family esterase